MDETRVDYFLEGYG